MSGSAEQEPPSPLTAREQTGNEEEEEEPAPIDVGSPVYFAPSSTTVEEAGDSDGDSPAFASADDNGDDEGDQMASATEAEAEADSAASHHLVEGDFFPEAPASVLEEIESQANDDEEAENAARGEPANHQQPDSKRAKAEGNDNDGEEVDKAGTVATAPAPPPSPPKAARPAKRKRVSWSGVLVQRVTTFHMPDRGAGPVPVGDASSPTFAAPPVAPAPQSIFSDKTNTDGTRYRCCKAQRPAQRFLDWKRQAQHPPATTAPAAASPPFVDQPRDNDSDDTKQQQHPAKDAPTLFAGLFRRAAGWRRPDPHNRHRAATTAPWAARCPQLPYTDPAALFDEPQPLPL